MVMPRAENAQEYLDRPAAPGDREAELADIDRLNAWFAGYRLTVRAVQRLTVEAAADRRLLVVDVGGGRGHLGLRLARRACRQGRRLRVVVVDRDGTPVRVEGDLLRVRGDATALPFREGAADVVTMSLTLHHLEPEAAVRCLAEMGAVARQGVVINDLLRTRLTLALVWMATRLFARTHFARHDGPLSVRRAYGPAELRVLAEKAGFTRVDIRRYPWFGRLVAVLT